MSKAQWGPDRKLGRMMLLGMLIMAGALAVAMALAGCSSGPQLQPRKTYEQVWIEAHPTHAGPNGECVEWDDEPCDDDPFDLDDLREAKIKVTSPAAKPKPSPSPTAKPRPVPSPSKRR